MFGSLRPSKNPFRVPPPSTWAKSGAAEIARDKKTADINRSLFIFILAVRLG